MWFAVFLQLFLIIGVLSILGGGDISAFRLQACAFSTMAAVFAVIGVDMSIFAGQPARGAMAAGWLLLAIVDILWVLFFTAEPGTPLARLVETMTVHSPRGSESADTERQASSSRSGEVRVSKFSEAEIRSDASPDETKVGHDRNGDPHDGSSPEMSRDWTGMGRPKIVDRTQDTLAEEEEAPENKQNYRFPPPSSKNRRAVYVEEPRHLSTIYDHPEGTSENGDSHRDSTNLYPFKVRARSDCRCIPSFLNTSLISGYVQGFQKVLLKLVSRRAIYCTARKRKARSGGKSGKEMGLSDVRNAFLLIRFQSPQFVRSGPV